MQEFNSYFTINTKSQSVMKTTEVSGHATRNVWILSEKFMLYKLALQNIINGYWKWDVLLGNTKRKKNNYGELKT